MDKVEEAARALDPTAWESVGFDAVAMVVRRAAATETAKKVIAVLADPNERMVAAGAVVLADDDGDYPHLATEVFCAMMAAATEDAG